MATKIIIENPLQMGKVCKYDNTLNKPEIKNTIKRKFYRIMQAMTEYENLPDTIPKIMLERYMLEYGWTFVTKHDDKLYAFMGGLGGELNEYYIPTLCIVANPYLNFSEEFVIDRDGILCKNDSQMQGMDELFDIYSQLLTENLVTMNMVSIHYRNPGLTVTGNSNTVESAKRFYKKLYDGELDIVFGSTLYDSIKTLPVEKRNDSLHDLVDYHQYTLSLLYNECGLDANMNMKKERMITSEVGLNHAALHAWTDDMMQMRKENCEKINKMFGTNIKVKLASGWNLDRIFEQMETLGFSERSENTEDKKEILNEDEEREKLLNSLKER